MTVPMTHLGDRGATNSPGVWDMLPAGIAAVGQRAVVGPHHALQRLEGDGGEVGQPPLVFVLAVHPVLQALEDFNARRQCTLTQRYPGNRGGKGERWRDAGLGAK
jgi:hypothetical protein